MPTYTGTAEERRRALDAMLANQGRGAIGENAPFFAGSIAPTFAAPDSASATAADAMWAARNNRVAAAGASAATGVGTALEALRQRKYDERRAEIDKLAAEEAARRARGSGRRGGGGGGGSSTPTSTYVEQVPWWETFDFGDGYNGPPPAPTTEASPFAALWSDEPNNNWMVRAPGARDRADWEARNRRPPRTPLTPIQGRY